MSEDIKTFAKRAHREMIDQNMMGWPNVIYDLLRYTEHLESELAAHQWISVEEKLPKKPSWNVGLWPSPFDSNNPPYIVFHYYGQELGSLKWYFEIQGPEGIDENYGKYYDIPEPLEK